MNICKFSACTGCGMCSNACPHSAITMNTEKHGFVFPSVDVDKCVKCGLCAKLCPSNSPKKTDNTMSSIYAAWNKDKNAKKISTSGGIFGIISKEILDNGGVVVGAMWNDDFGVEHSIAFSKEDADKFKGSKYVQSNMGNIYTEIKDLLINGRKVLFSGTPCQVCALKTFLGKYYPNLITVDLVCHGVPSNECLQKHLSEVIPFEKKICKIRLRYKSPYWDYSSVRIDCDDGTYYQKYTVNDAYFNLFNIGFSLRESCHTCKYTTLHREGDITLADFWGYKPNNFKMRNYLGGVSLVAINSEDGKHLFDKISNQIVFEQATLNAALASNKSFSEPYTLQENQLEDFWSDYESGVSIESLNQKYIKNPFTLPKLLWLRRIVKRYYWLFNR